MTIEISRSHIDTPSRHEHIEILHIPSWDLAILEIESIARKNYIYTATELITGLAMVYGCGFWTTIDKFTN